MNNCEETTIENEGGDENGSRGDGEFCEPICDEQIKPYVGQMFHSEEVAIAFYKEYAEFCGFDVRLGSATKSREKDVYIWRYLLCNREGEKIVNNVVGEEQEEENTKRRRVSNRCNCMARLVIKYSGAEGYEVTQFKDRHTHMMVGDSSKHFLKINRKMDYMHQKFYLNCHRASIGPMKSFKLLKETLGGFENVGYSSMEFKNFGRDMRAYVAGSDAQMVLETMHDKLERCSGYVFEYQVDEEDHLKCIFWADPTARRNYHVFGDVVSVDATYNTNKYGMRFLPFTGKDNHGKIMTFCAGLIAREDVDSYVWVFEKFKACMSKIPHIILTDQDPAAKIAIERVMEGTRHRLCIWHIMKKAPKKVAKLLDENKEFLKRFSCIVWCDFIKPEKFELKWKDLMQEHGLGSDDWFKSMYEIRKFWIPAYFIDVPMGALIKTTSISESVNSFFGTYTRSYSNLVEFFMHFDNTIDAQRHSNAQLNELDKSSKHDLQTHLLIEKHAQTIYTNCIFKEVQEDIVDGFYHCPILKIETDGDKKLHVVGNRDPLKFTVTYNEREATFSCGCMRFNRSGFVCCHMIAVFKNLGLEMIPEKYLMWRWSKHAYSRPVHSYVDDVPNDVILVQERKLKLNMVNAKYHDVLALIEGADIEMMDYVLKELTMLEDGVRRVGGSDMVAPSREDIFERFYGRKLPQEITVLPPLTVKAKGSGSRLKSRKEKATLQAKKPLRKCSRCKQISRHDARNCKVDLEANESESEGETESASESESESE